MKSRYYLYRLKRVLFAACCLLFAVSWPIGAAAEEPPSSMESLEDAEHMPEEMSGDAEPSEEQDDRSLLFIAYVSADHRHELAASYVSSISNLYKNTFILWQFGLATLEQVQMLKGEYEKALSDADQWAAARDTAFAELKDRMEAYVPQSGVRSAQEALEPEDSPAVQDADEPEDDSITQDELDAQQNPPPERGGETFQTLQEAMEKVNQAERELYGAQFQHQSGMISLEQLIAAHQAAYEAKWAVEEAKTRYYESILENLAGSDGNPVPWIALIEEIHQDDPGLIQEWIDSWKRMVAADDLSDRVIQPVDQDGFRQLPLEALAVMVTSTSWLQPSYVNADGEVYVPLRAYAEALGYAVTWDSQSRRIALIRGDDEVQFGVGSRTAIVNDNVKEWGSPPFIVQGQTYVPLSFVSTVLQANVYWNHEMQIGMIIP